MGGSGDHDNCWFRTLAEDGAVVLPPELPDFMLPTETEPQLLRLHRPGVTGESERRGVRKPLCPGKTGVLVLGTA